MDDLRAVTAMRASEAAASGDGGGVGNVENARLEILRHVEREHEADRRTSCQSLTLDAGDTSQRGGSDFRATDRTSVAPSPPAAAISARFTEAPPFEERAAAPEAPEAPHAPAGGVNTLDHRLLFTSSKGSCVWSVDKVMFGRGNSVPEGAVPRAFPHRISPWGGSFAHVTVGERPRVERGRTSSSGLPSRKFEGRIRCGPQGDRPRRQRRACVLTTMRKPKSQMRMRQYQIRRPDDIGQNIVIWLLLPAACCLLLLGRSSTALLASCAVVRVCGPRRGAAAAFDSRTFVRAVALDAAAGGGDDDARPPMLTTRAPAAAATGSDTSSRPACVHRPLTEAPPPAYCSDGSRSGRGKDAAHA